MASKLSVLSATLDLKTKKEYDIFIGNRCLSDFDKWMGEQIYDGVFVLVDSNTKRECLPSFVAIAPAVARGMRVIEIQSGERAKTIETVVHIWHALLSHEASRHAVLVNIGGGVVTDMGAFAASVYKRGIAFVQIPTTLLAQVDASVGGKTGIDYQNVKNTIGTFARPSAIFIDPDFLKTLPEREIRSGFAEMIKHGLILDAAYYDELKAMRPRDVTTEAIYHSVVLKNDIVCKDPMERGKYRKALNFGHTVGHAIEGFLLDTENALMHGEAIAAGMICEAFLSSKKCGLSERALMDITTFLSSNYPAAAISESSDGAILNLMRNDKKKYGDAIHVTLIKSIGQFESDYPCSEKEICESLDYYRSITSKNHKTKERV